MGLGGYKMIHLQFFTGWFRLPLKHYVWRYIVSLKKNSWNFLQYETDYESVRITRKKLPFRVTVSTSLVPYNKYSLDQITITLNVRIARFPSTCLAVSWFPWHVMQCPTFCVLLQVDGKGQFRCATQPDPSLHGFVCTVFKTRFKCMQSASWSQLSCTLWLSTRRQLTDTPCNGLVMLNYHSFIDFIFISNLTSSFIYV